MVSGTIVYTRVCVEEQGINKATAVTPLGENVVVMISYLPSC